MPIPAHLYIPLGWWQRSVSWEWEASLRGWDDVQRKLPVLLHKAQIPKQVAQSVTDEGPYGRRFHSWDQTVWASSLTSYGSRTLTCAGRSEAATGLATQWGSQIVPSASCAPSSSRAPLFSPFLLPFCLVKCVYVCVCVLGVGGAYVTINI